MLRMCTFIRMRMSRMYSVKLLQRMSSTSVNKCTTTSHTCLDFHMSTTNLLFLRTTIRMIFGEYRDVFCVNNLIGEE
jgi:hypothetical protein